MVTCCWKPHLLASARCCRQLSAVAPARHAVDALGVHTELGAQRTRTTGLNFLTSHGITKTLTGTAPTLLHLERVCTLLLAAAGLPRDILSAYPTLAAFRSAVAAAPAVAAYYAKESDEVRLAGFRPDADAQAPA